MTILTASNVYIHDIFMSVSLGFIGGCLLSLAFIAEPAEESNWVILITPVAFSLLGYFGFLAFSYFSKWLPGLVQLAKFCIVGFLSSAIEIGLINVLFTLSGHSEGLYFSAFKAFTFVVALSNGYFFNRTWTFNSKNEKKKAEFSKYAGVNIIGIFINVGTASFIVNVIEAPISVAPTVWANIGVITAIFVTMVWNFLSYKYIVFSRRTL